ncbi:MAG: hypothetical protein AB1861_20250 [Cyanobacteriota bacterium]
MTKQWNFRERTSAGEQARAGIAVLMNNKACNQGYDFSARTGFCSAASASITLSLIAFHLLHLKNLTPSLFPL